MPDKTNYKFFRRAGFLPFEASAYSRTTREVKGKRRIHVDPVPLDVPYVKDMIAQRRVMFRKANKRGMSKAGYRRMINELYRRTGRLTPDGKPDAWQSIREWEERGQDKFPHYESPGGKKPRKSRKDFKKKMGK